MSHGRFPTHRTRIGVTAILALAAIACTNAAIEGNGGVGGGGGKGGTGASKPGSSGTGGVSINLSSTTASTGGTTSGSGACNGTSTVGCKAEYPPACGDGINNQSGIEECDDGNVLPGDGCNGNCKVERNWTCPKAGPCTRDVVCGDGQIGPGEVCDDGNTKDGDGCNSTCTVQDPAFKCEAGQPCVRTSQCGNKRIEPGEDCDDGNTKDGDGCTSSCQLEGGYVCPIPGAPCKLAPRCGDGVVQASIGEVCDDGNQKDGDGCSADCKTKDSGCTCTPGKACVCPVVKCGNGSIEGSEDCDDANTASGDGCSSTCQLESGYECRVPGKRCTPKCGDSTKLGSETCDDGNTTSGDGCSSTCQIEPGATCPTVGQACIKAVCGNGKQESGELCDCGTDPTKLPTGCNAVNGLFYGDGKGCSKTCTKEPNCQDASGKTQACTTSCGDGNLDPGEDCDDGNGLDGDGCSSKCKKEGGFTCSTATQQDSATCQSGSGQCLELPIIYRDFQPENVTSGGHPDFYFLGTRYNGSKSSSTVCVPNSGGPGKGNDSTTRCWGIMAPNLLKGKPQPGTTTTCACQFSDWNISNTGHIPTTYTQAGNDSPLSDGNGGYLGGTAGAAVSTTSTAGTYAGTLSGYTAGIPGGPIFKGTVPAYKNATSFNQWFNDDATVNKTFTSVLELTAIGTNVYQYASQSHLAQGGFFPLDTLNPAQATLCNLWPYWNHGNGNPIWTTCTGDQYLFPPRVLQTDCPNQNPLSNGCWVAAVPGVKHDSYFTDEARYYFVYDGTGGISLSFFGDDDLFIFVNGHLAIDLGGVHQRLPGRVQVAADGMATIIEGGEINPTTGVINDCTVANPYTLQINNATCPGGTCDCRTRTVNLGLAMGKTYEIAVFHADRHPTESNYQLTLSGFSTNKSNCGAACGDGVVSGAEECDDGPMNNDTAYGACTTKCKFGPFCGDNIKNGTEDCDLGHDNVTGYGKRDGCTTACSFPHYCGDSVVDVANGEKCDQGEAVNGMPGSPCDVKCQIGIQ